MERYQLKRIDAELYSVKGHSIIRKISLGARNLNANDSYANIANWRAFCNVVLKGKTQEQTYSQEGKTVEVDFEYKGYKIHERINIDRGLLKALHQLELPDVRKRIETEERLEEIEEKIKRLRREKRNLLKR